jgi:aryl-alcohol dehydrogenase-like predicted oxidoreductase
MHYRIFGRTGLKVSQLALGAANFGTGWGYGSDRETSMGVYDAFREAGGNFVDTADQYQFGQSEEMLADFMASDRDDVVLATKFALGARPGIGLQGTGNSRKAMFQCVEASLRRLKTDRIDLLWVHFPDDVTAIDEIARGLDDLVRSGKILYAGLSNFPAWRVATAVTLAELRGWAPVVGIQIEYSLVERTPERDLLPMARAFDLGVVGWSPLGGGLLTGKYRRGETGRKEGLGAVIHSEDDERKTRILDAVLEVAEEIAAPPGQVAIAWASAQGIVPIIGPRTPEQIRDNIAATSLTLSPEHLQRLSDASTISLGVPHEFGTERGNRDRLAGGKLDLLQGERLTLAVR